MHAFMRVLGLEAIAPILGFDCLNLCFSFLKLKNVLSPSYTARIL